VRETFDVSGLGTDAVGIGVEMMVETSVEKIGTEFTFQFTGEFVEVFGKAKEALFGGGFSLRGADTRAVRAMAAAAIAIEGVFAFIRSGAFAGIRRNASTSYVKQMNSMGRGRALMNSE